MRHNLQIRTAMGGGFLLALLAAVGPSAPGQQPPGGRPPDLLSAREKARLGNHHADAGAKIDSKNVGDLKQAWKADADAHVTHTPLIHDGKVYFADWGGAVYCVDAKSGEQKWKKAIEKKVKTEWPWHGFAGTGSIGDGMLFEASVEGTAYAIDLGSGEVRWTKTIAEDDEHAGNVGRILYHDGLLYIGVASVEEMLTTKKDIRPNFRGRVLALDARSGNQVWRLDLAQPPHNGAGVWSSFALDPVMNLLFFTTSNNYTGRANDYSDAILAVDPRTGREVWKFQATEHDVWTKADPIGPDYAFGAGPQLYDVITDGGVRHLVGAGQKSGVYWVLDRRNGQKVWSTVVGYGGMGGGIHAEAAIARDRIFVWSNNGYNYGDPPDKFPLTIKALDGSTGRNVWALPKIQPAAVPSAGCLANDVYFVGSLDGMVRAYDTRDGRRLWASSAEGGSIATSLVVHDDTLYFGTGLPKTFGGIREGNALVAYRASR